MRNLLKDNFNFIPEEYLLKEKARRQKQILKFALPVFVLLLILPVWLLFSKNAENKDEISLLLAEKEKLQSEISALEPVEKKIEDLKGRISVFGDLLDNSYKKVINIRNIEQYIPREIVYTKISLVFSDYNDTSEQKSGSQEPPRVKIYENIPNIMVIEGRTDRLEAVSRFVYQLNNDPLVEVVNMEQIGWLTDRKMNSFLITVEIKEGTDK